MQPGPANSGAAKVVQLDQVGIPRLLFALLHQRFSGTLQLQQSAPEAGTRTVWLEGGMPIYTDWIAPSEVLGQVLVDIGSITQAQLIDCLQVMATEGGVLGEILLEQGVLDRAGLLQGLARQCARKLVHLFALEQGEVTVTAELHDLQELVTVNVLELIAAGVAVHYTATRIERELGAALHGPVQATPALQRYQAHFRFRPTDEPILEALGHGTQLETLATIDGVTHRRAAQIIYTLWSCQMLRVGASAGASLPGPKTPRPVRHTPVPALRHPPTRPDSAPPPARATAHGGTPASRRPRTRTLVDEPPPKPPSRPRSPEQELLRVMEPLERKIAGGANPFELLGVPLTAGKQDIRRAWSELSRKMHPDALQAKGLSHLRQRVGSVFAALSEAHMQLSDKDKREQLKAQIERGEDPKANQEAASTARAAFESEVIAKEADKLLRAGKFDRALARYGEALAMNAGELDLQAAAIWCRYNLTDRSRETALAAEKQLATIVKTSPNLARAHYFRGMVLKDLGAYEPAMAAFGNAQLADPRLIDAERQARALRMGRTQNRDSGRFGLKGLFGKR